MHNGCLLLLAFIAVFQPIASNTERVDGRQQRCDYRTSLRDPGVHFHGSYRFTKPAVDDRRLNQREDIREVRRNEVREESLRTASSSDRRLGDTLERNENTLTRSARNRIGNEADLHRDLRETRLPADRHQRNQDTRRERLSRVQETDQLHRPSRQTTRRLSENENRYESRIDTRRFNEARVSIESRRDTRRNGNYAEPQRAIERETRAAINREGIDVINSLDERRITRERFQRMAMRRSESRIQLDRNADRELQRRSREFRSSKLLSDRVNRAYDNEESRITAPRDDTRSLDRDDRRTSSSRRTPDERMRDMSRIQRQRLSADRRNIDESATRRNRDLHDRTVENRLVERARSTESRREDRNTERNARLTRAVRSVDDRVSQNDRSGSRIFERKRSVENRRDVRDARSMDRIRTLERSAENRRDSRSADRERVLELRRDIRNIERESQPIMNNNRVTETRRDIRNTERDSRILERSGRTAEIRNKRDTCVFARERSTMMRQRMLTMDRAVQSERNTRSVERETRTHRLERAVANQDVDDVETILARGRERVSESRRELRSIDRARSLENKRDTRNDGSRTYYRAERTEESRRNVRNIESRVFRTEPVENRRAARNVESPANIIERAVESRHDIHNMDSRVSRSHHTGEHRRDTRNVESRVFRAVRVNEDRRDTRNVDSRAFRTERTDESRRDIRIADNRVFRTERAADNRREVRDFERLSRSLNSVADYRRDNRNNERDARVNERTSESRRDIQNSERQSQNEERVIDIRRVTRNLERDSRMNARERSVETNSNRRAVARDSRTSVIERLSGDRRERVTENRRDVRNIRLLNAAEGRRVDSRAMNLFRSRTDLTMERKNERVAERLSKRDSLDSRPGYTLQRESRKVSEGDNVPSRLREATRSANFARQREFQSMFINPAQIEEETPTMNWQYMFYTLQGLYICGVLIQFMSEKTADKKTRNSWWSAPQHLIKVD